jgi:hypothetical protein
MTNRVLRNWQLMILAILLRSSLGLPASITCRDESAELRKGASLVCSQKGPWAG